MLRLAEIDVNLLVVFDLLYRERNTQRVADRLGVTQPAVSHALKRLRRLLADELFERTSRGLQPTPRASQLHPGIAEALARLHDTLNLHDDFDPATSERTFRLAMTDIGEIVFLPRLLGYLAREAPGVRLSTLRSHREDLKRDMEEGRVDLAIGLIPQLGAGFYQRGLFVQRYVCLMRQDHPLAAGTFGLEEFKAATHAVVVAKGTGHGIVEEELARAGVTPGQAGAAPLRRRALHHPRQRPGGHGDRQVRRGHPGTLRPGGARAPPRLPRDCHQSLLAPALPPGCRQPLAARATLRDVCRVRPRPAPAYGAPADQARGGLSSAAPRRPGCCGRRSCG
ncbi:LysR family transcriptional regulator [Halomonas sp. BM-2019]|uniref:LysR family transcriptional regulator n=1 Tax=Halomonas sp. BM-2019 TaxID=2811227 RepID=UPI0031FBA8D9